jgi:hypothetical protein
LTVTASSVSIWRAAGVDGPILTSEVAGIASALRIKGDIGFFEPPPRKARYTINQEPSEK